MADQSEKAAPALADADRKELRDYAWKYFALHADQRLRTFNFYLLIVAVVVGGLLAYLKDARSPAYAAPAAFLLAVLSYVFWRLDRRAIEFIRHGEHALAAIEKDIPADRMPEGLRLFVREDETTKAIRRERGVPGWNPISWVWGHFGYYHCFKAMFAVLFILGIGVGIAAFFLPGSPPPAAPPVPQQNFYIGSQPVNHGP
jgi:hypothetical protein